MKLEKLGVVLSELTVFIGGTALACIKEYMDTECKHAYEHVYACAELPCTIKHTFAQTPHAFEHKGK